MTVMNEDILYQNGGCWAQLRLWTQHQPHHYALVDTDEGLGSSLYSSKGLQVLRTEQAKATGAAQPSTLE